LQKALKEGNIPVDLVSEMVDADMDVRIVYNLHRCAHGRALGTGQVGAGVDLVGSCT
jgi:hypothetical protein